VSWRYYVFEGGEPDCESDEAMTCEPVKQGPKTPGIWNPLVDFGVIKMGQSDGRRAVQLAAVACGGDGEHFDGLADDGA